MEQLFKVALIFKPVSSCSSDYYLCNLDLRTGHFQQSILVFVFSEENHQSNLSSSCFKFFQTETFLDLITE